MAIANFLQTVRGIKATEYRDLMPLAANQYLRNDGGRFMYVDTNGNYALAGAAQTQLDAWVDECYASDHTGATAQISVTPFQGSASDGVTVVSGTRDIHTEVDAYWIPSADTLLLSYIGLRCDLVVTGSTTTTKQLLKPTVTTNKIVRILNVDLGNNLALVYAQI